MGKATEDGGEIVRWWVCEGCGERRKVIGENGKRGKRTEELDGRRVGELVGKVIGDLLLGAVVLWMLIWKIGGLMVWHLG